MKLVVRQQADHRHCEEASPTKQSIRLRFTTAQRGLVTPKPLGRRRMDCRASLAMTAENRSGGES